MAREMFLDAEEELGLFLRGNLAFRLGRLLEVALAAVLLEGHTTGILDHVRATEAQSHGETRSTQRSPRSQSIEAIRRTSRSDVDAGSSHKHKPIIMSWLVFVARAGVHIGLLRRPLR